MKELEVMTGVIERTNERESPMLVWVAPFDVPVYVDCGETLRFEFSCSESEILSREFGAYHHLTFPLECQPHVSIQRSEEVVPVNLHRSESVRMDHAVNTACKFQRMIDHLQNSLKTTQDFQIGDDCAHALNSIGSVAAIEALFCAYGDVQQSLVQSLQPRIIYWLNLCKFDTPEKRTAGRNRLEFLYGLIAAAPTTHPGSCRRALYILSKLKEEGDETLNLVVSLIEQIADTTDNEWKVTRDAALLFVEKRAPNLIRQNVKLTESLRGSSVFDPMRCCQVCNYLFLSQKQLGDICPDCGFEFGVDDAAHYRRPESNDG